MATLDTKITSAGLKSLLTKGASFTFNQFSVMDTVRYDVQCNVSADLEMTKSSGVRNLVTEVKHCGKSSISPVSSTPLTDDEKELVTDRVVYNFGLTDCNNEYETTNLTANIHLNRWKNYVEGLASSDYVSTAKLQVPIFNFVEAHIQSYNTSTKVYERVETKTQLVPTYTFSTEKDLQNYSLLNNNYVQIESGRRSIVESKTSDRFPSPIALYMSTQMGVEEKVVGQQMVLTIVPLTQGYVLVSNPKQKTPTIDNFMSIRDFNNLTDEQIESYYTIYPAMLIGKGTKDIDLYYMSSAKLYNTPSDRAAGNMIWGYKNYLGTSLVSGLMNKMANFMKVYGTEVSSGVYEYTIKMEINTSNNVYSNVVGGKVDLTFVYDINDVISDYYNIVELVAS